MNKKLRFSLLFLCFTCLMSFTSCNTLWMKFSGVLDARPSLKTLSNGNKTVLYLPLHHIGRKEYYTNLTHKVDSLQKLGYVVFYESVSGGTTDTIELQYLAKKFRKIQGDFNASNGYLDTTNHTIYGRIPYDETYDLINQPTPLQLGLHSNFARNVDVSLKELVTAFEHTYGPVQLSACDSTTPLNADYNCTPLKPKLAKDFKKKYVLGLRNKKLASEIVNSKHQHIFVIYGAMHFKGLFQELKNGDSKWKKG